jgi:hypothetical protein
MESREWKKVKFPGRIYNWLGTSSLAIEFRELYVIVQEKSKTVYDLWDGTSLKRTFRRYVVDRLMNMWLEVVQIA